MNTLLSIVFLFLTVTLNLRADWPTFGADPQRTGLYKDETHITKDNVKNLKVRWKLHLDSPQKQMTALTVPVIADSLTTQFGIKDVVVVGGSADKIFGVNADTGKLLWQKQLTIEGAPKQQPNVYCPYGLNATPVVANPGFFATVYLISSDGKMYSMNPVDGEDRSPPFQFVPPFSKNWSLNLFDGVIYTPISQGCNSAKSGVYAVDIKDPKHPISFFQASAHGAGIWGRAGVAIGTDGRVYAGTGDGSYNPTKGNYADTIVALSPRELKLVDYYTPANQEWIDRRDLDLGCISPVVFSLGSLELVVMAGKEGLFYLMDKKSLGGDDHRTPLYRSPIFTNEDVDDSGKGFWGALSTWEDSKGTRWLYAPAWGAQAKDSPKFPLTYGSDTNGSVMAFKVVMKDGKPVLSPAWRSRDMSVPEPVIIANGIVFALSNGENIKQTKASGQIITGQERASTPAGNAVLYALDAETGKELFSSGKAIPSWTHMSGLAISHGRIFITTYDSDLYCFKLEGDMQ